MALHLTTCCIHVCMRKGEITKLHVNLAMRVCEVHTGVEYLYATVYVCVSRQCRDEMTESRNQR